jgi:hypothetical protein
MSNYPNAEDTAVDRRQETVITQQPGYAATEQVTRDVASEKRQTLFQINRILYTLLGGLEILLAARFVLKLIGANPGSGFAAAAWPRFIVFCPSSWGIVWGIVIITDRCRAPLPARPASRLRAGRATSAPRAPSPRTDMRLSFNKSIGSLLLAIWLILTGLAHFVPAIAGLAVVLAIVAIVAGVFILLGR